MSASDKEKAWIEEQRQIIMDKSEQLENEIMAQMGNVMDSQESLLPKIKNMQF